MPHLARCLFGNRVSYHPRQRPLSASLLLQLALMAILTLTTVADSQAQTQTKFQFNVEAGEAGRTLKAFAQQAGREILLPAKSLRGTKTQSLQGSYTVREGLDLLLAGTDLHVHEDQQSGALVVQRRDDPNVERVAPPTGSRPVPSAPASNDESERGRVEGRVLNVATGRYLGNARITLLDTGAEQLTDALGYYRFNQVRSGAVTVRAFYTGLQAVDQRVTVLPGETTTYDFQLDLMGEKESAVVKLDTFLVATGRETDGAANAINEQRFSPNIKSVVSTSEFNEITSGNIIEFVKFIPGVSVVNDAIQVRGFPDSMTAVTVDDNRVASAAQSGETRRVILDHLILNNVSRIEVTKVPTPDRPADAIGGSVNLVSKSAFEQVKPIFTYRTFFSWVDEDSLTFGKTPGPVRDTAKIRPGVDLSWIVPVNERFGFTATLTHMEQSQPQGLVGQEWVPTSGVTSGMTPSTPDKPYVRQYQTRDGPRLVKRSSAAVNFDYKLTPRDVISFGGMFTRRSLRGDFKTINSTVGTGVTDFSPTHTQGLPTRGQVTISWTQNSTEGMTFQPTLKYRHEGTLWRIDAAASYSQATDAIPGIEETGTFNTGSVTLRNATVRIDEIRDQRARITASDSAGRPIDIYNLNNYVLSSAGDNPRNSVDIVKTARINVGRDLDLAIPLSVKAGFDIRQNTRDIEKPGARSFNFIGRDGIANTADDIASVILDESFSQRSTPYYPQPLQVPSASRAYDLYVANPTYFRLSNALAPWQNEVNSSKWMEETITAGYVRFDSRLFRSKLWLVGGVRYERTRDEGQGALQDPARVPDTVTDPVEVNRLTWVKRGTQVSTEYGDFYPSFSATYDVSERIVARLGYARTISRPDFSHIIPGANVPDPDSTSRTITLKNPALKPWQANNYDVSLEYYFSGSGSFTVGAFRKDIEDFFGAITVPVTPELLAPYGIDPNVYSAENGYVVSTALNSGTARVSGIEVNYRQNLRFLPDWAQGLQIFGSLTMNRLEGERTANFSHFIPRTYTLGFNLKRRKFNLSANVNSQGERRQALFTSAGAATNTYDYQTDPQTYNASAEYVVTRHLSFFISALNIGARAPWNSRYSPETPDYARLRTIGDTRFALYSLGIKGTF